MPEDYGELPIEDFTHQLLWNLKVIAFGVWLIAGLILGSMLL